MDRRWFEGPDEGQFSIQSFYFWVCLTKNLGLSSGIGRTPPKRHYMHIPCLSWFLLYSETRYINGISLKSVRRCSHTFSQVPNHLRNFRCTTQRNLTSKTTFPSSLPLSYPTIWCTQWVMFVNHRIEAHKSCQRAMATVKPKSATRPNAGHKSVPWPACCRQSWFCQSRYAWWVMYVFYLSHLMTLMDVPY